jgi:hypothetical protein
MDGLYPNLAELNAIYFVPKLFAGIEKNLGRGDSNTAIAKKPML